MEIIIGNKINGDESNVSLMRIPLPHTIETITIDKKYIGELNLVDVLPFPVIFFKRYKTKNKVFYATLIFEDIYVPTNRKTSDIIEAKYQQIQRLNKIYRII